MGIRGVVFLLGLALMFLGLFFPYFVTNERAARFGLFDLGLLLAIGAPGWPDGLH